jgi:hypothetical protein
MVVVMVHTFVKFFLHISELWLYTSCPFRSVKSTTFQIISHVLYASSTLPYYLNCLQYIQPYPTLFTRIYAHTFRSSLYCLLHLYTWKIYCIKVWILYMTRMVARDKLMCEATPFLTMSCQIMEVVMSKTKSISELYPQLPVLDPAEYWSRMVGSVRI